MPSKVKHLDEPSLINLFKELTGESENSARSVLMYLDIIEHDQGRSPQGEMNTGQAPSASPANGIGPDSPAPNSSDAAA